MIGLYQPQRLKGRIFRGIARFMTFMRVPRFAPNHPGNPAVTPAVAWLRPAADAGTVGFLGCNPAHGWRCILTGIDPETGASFIAKLGLDEGANSVRREDAILRGIHGKYPGIVRSMGCEFGPDWALLRLPHLGNRSPKTMADPRIGKLLASWLAEGSTPLASNPWAMDLIKRVDQLAVTEGWHERMMSHRIRRALMHGDFAVWNLRVAGEHLCAIDLEWAEENGIAGIDLIHGLRQEGYMVRKQKPSEAVAWMINEVKGPRWAEYMQSSGWAEAPTDLISIGLLHSHFNAINDSAELLAVLGIRL